MKTNQAFWDSSALTLLCCNQPSTPLAQKLARQYKKTVIWWGTSVEIQSAVARLRREGFLSEDEVNQAINQVEKMKTSWSLITPTETLRDLAENLPHKYQLRAMDALQLAAALTWCKNKPRNHRFICFDIRLAQAAEQAGFMVYPKP